MENKFKQKITIYIFDIAKWLALIAFSGATYYVVAPKYEFADHEVRKNKITGSIEFVEHCVWVDVLEDNARALKEEALKKEAESRFEVVG